VTVAAKAILTGIQIVEVSAFVAGPLAGTTLAELGADVIRVDPPGGGVDVNRWPIYHRRSLYWAGLNRGKRSITVDTTTRVGQSLVTGLAVRSGTVLTNLTVHKWMSYGLLKKRREDLIMGVIKGNPDGTSAVDYTVNAALGYPWVTGPDEGRAPVNHVLPAWDAMAGYLLTAGIVAAHLHRLLTGEGQYVDLSLSDVGLSLSSHLGFLAEAQLKSEPRERHGNFIFGSFGRDFRTIDGRHIMLVALTARQWESLIETTGLRLEMRSIEKQSGLDLSLEGDRFQLRNEIVSLLEPWIAARSYAEISALFNRNNVLWGPYQSFKELMADDDRASARNAMFGVLDQPGIGPHLAAASPLAFSGFRRAAPKPAPRMGEHTSEVLESVLGLSSSEIRGLEREGVIGPSTSSAP
jgi:2-methylfumaryl-CoA isomerase